VCGVARRRRRGPTRRVADIAWEADVDGTGLWITHPGGDIEEVVAPTRWVERYVNPAGWRFAEHAYAAWLTHHHTAQPGTARGGAGGAAADQAQIAVLGEGVSE
jgi:hypothetical protein